MQKSTAANRPIQTMGIYNVNDSQQIVNRTTDDSSDDQQVNCSNFDPVVSDNETNNQHQYPGGSQPNTSLHQPTSSRAQTSSHDNLSHLSRPKLKIEPYDGDPMKWNLWYGLFTTLIHNQPISLAEKMTHLQTLTTGIANEAISGFSCNSQMYDAALAELQRRFGRPEIIVNKFLHLLQNFRQPSIQQRHTFTEFSTFINNLVETFQSLGFTNDLNSTLYVQFAVNKLPPTQRLQWTQYAVSNNLQQPSLIHFNIWIRQFALACDNLPFNLDDRPTSSSISKNQLSRVTPVKQHRPLCPFDNMDHHPAYCSTYKNATLEQRRRMVLEKKTLSQLFRTTLED